MVGSFGTRSVCLFVFLCSYLLIKISPNSQCLCRYRKLQNFESFGFRTICKFEILQFGSFLSTNCTTMSAGSFSSLKLSKNVSRSKSVDSRELLANNNDKTKNGKRPNTSYYKISSDDDDDSVDEKKSPATGNESNDHNADNDNDTNIYQKRINMIKTRGRQSLNLDSSSLRDLMVHSQLYKKHWKVLIPFGLSLIIMLLYNIMENDTHRDKPITLEAWQFIILLLTSGITFTICLGTIMYSCINCDTNNRIKCSSIDSIRRNTWRDYYKGIESFSNNIVQLIHPYLNEIESKEYKELQPYFCKSEKTMIVFSVFFLLYAAFSLCVSAFLKNSYHFDLTCDQALNDYQDMYWKKRLLLNQIINMLHQFVLYYDVIIVQHMHLFFVLLVLHLCQNKQKNLILI